MAVALLLFSQIPSTSAPPVAGAAASGSGIIQTTDPPQYLTDQLAGNGVGYGPLTDAESAQLRSFVSPAKVVSRAQAELGSSIVPTVYLGSLSDPRPATAGATSGTGNATPAFGLLFSDPNATFRVDANTTYHIVVFFFGATDGQPIMLSGLG